MATYGIAIVIDGGGGNGQWRRVGNLMGDGDGNVIAKGNGDCGTMDSGTAM
jgi:hypothetical protein